MNACAQRVVQRCDHASAADRQPDEAGHPTLIRRPWDVDLTGRHRQRRHPASGIRARSIAAFKRGDADFHAQEQAVIGLTGIADAVVVEDAGFGPAHTIPEGGASRDPCAPAAMHRGTAQRRPCPRTTTPPRHHATTPPRDQSVARAGERRWQPRQCSAGGSAKIVVDELDVGKAVPTRNVDKVIVLPLALKVGHDPGLRRWTHAHDGHALQDLHRDQVRTVIAGCLHDKAFGLHQDLASVVAAFARSAALVPPALRGLDIRLICRPEVGAIASVCFIAVLPCMSIPGRGVCQNSARCDLPSQVGQRREANLRRAVLLSAQTTGSGIRQRTRADTARSAFHRQKPAGCPLLYPPHPGALARTGMPWITNLPVFADMGSRNGTCLGPSERALSGLAVRRQIRSRRLHPDRDRQAKPHRSAGLTHQRTRPHPAPQDQPPRQPAAMQRKTIAARPEAPVCQPLPRPEDRLCATATARRRASGTFMRPATTSGSCHTAAVSPGLPPPSDSYTKGGVLVQAGRA